MAATVMAASLSAVVLALLLALQHVGHRADRLAWAQERRELLDRLQARNLGEFKAVQQAAPGGTKPAPTLMQRAAAEATRKGVAIDDLRVPAGWRNP